MNDFLSRKRLLLGLLLSLLLSACNGGSSSQSAVDQSSADEPDPASLCITTDCGSREVLVRLPEAENLIFTPDGRLFVSGIELFEIIKLDDGSFEAVIVPMEGGHSASLGGLAVRDGILYLNDESQRGLWAGRLSEADMTMQKIHT